MKNKIRRLSKGSLSVVLSIMMVISTMLIGSFTVNAAVSQWYVVVIKMEIVICLGICMIPLNFRFYRFMYCYDQRKYQPYYFKLVAIENNNKIVLSPTGSSNVTYKMA